MRTIYKYTLREISGIQELELPWSAIIRSVGRQNDNICMWVEVETDDNEPYIRQFILFGTGQPIPVDREDQYYEYVGTVQIHPYVWHIYQKF